MAMSGAGGGGGGEQRFTVIYRGEQSVYLWEALQNKCGPG